MQTKNITGVPVGKVKTNPFVTGRIMVRNLFRLHLRLKNRENFSYADVRNQVILRFVTELTQSYNRKNE